MREEQRQRPASFGRALRSLLSSRVPVHTVPQRLGAPLALETTLQLSSVLVNLPVHDLLSCLVDIRLPCFPVARPRRLLWRRHMRGVPGIRSGHEVCRELVLRVNDRVWPTWP